VVAGADERTVPTGPSVMDSGTQLGGWLVSHHPALVLPSWVSREKTRVAPAGIFVGWKMTRCACPTADAASNTS